MPTINWKIWGSGIIMLLSTFLDTIGFGQLTPEVMALGAALGLYGVGQGVETIQTLKQKIMGGWKTWMLIVLLLASVVLTFMGHPIFAKILLGLGASIGVFGIAYKTVKVSTKV